MNDRSYRGVPNFNIAISLVWAKLDTTAARKNCRLAGKHAAFVALIVMSSLAFYKTLGALGTYSLRNDSSSNRHLNVPIIGFFSWGPEC